MPVRAPIEFRAVNNATGSANRIHSEDGAREYGFKGGLVPGAVTFSYVCEAVRRTQGDDWVADAFVHVRYLAPVYDGDLLQVAVGSLDGSSGEVRVTDAGQVCARGVWARLGAGRFSGSDEPLPEIPAGEVAVPLVGANLVNTEYLVSVPITIDEVECSAYLTELGLDASFHLDRGLAPLGYLARMYTRLIDATFERVGPSIHAATELQVVRPLRFGEKISLRGRVDRLFRRRGQGYWTFEMGWIDADGRTALRAMHTGIYDVKKRTTGSDRAPD